MKCFLKTSCDLREIHIRKLLTGHHFSCLRSNIISFQFRPITNTVPQTLHLQKLGIQVVFSPVNGACTRDFIAYHIRANASNRRPMEVSGGSYSLYLV